MLESLEIDSVQTLTQTSIGYNHKNKVNKTVELVRDIDFVNRTIYMTSDNLLWTYENGKSHLFDKQSTKEHPIPENLDQVMEESFKYPFALAALPYDYTFVRCDGWQTYGHLLRGKQIAFETKLPLMFGGDVAPLNYVFNRKEQAIGAFVKMGKDNFQVAVFDIERLKNNLPVNVKIDYYAWRTGELESTVVIETVAYNGIAVK